jgi:hypothetical protein
VWDEEEEGSKGSGSKEIGFKGQGKADVVPRCGSPVRLGVRVRPRARKRREGAEGPV